MVTLVKIALTSAMRLVEAATKQLVYVTMGVNQDGEDLIVKMNVVQDILARIVTVVVDIVWMKQPATISMERVMKNVSLGIKHRTVSMNVKKTRMDLDAMKPAGIVPMNHFALQ